MRYPLLSMIVLCSCSPKVIMMENRDSTVITVENRVTDTLISVEVPSERIITITKLDTVFVAQTALAEVEITPANGEYRIDLHHRSDARIEKIVQIPEQRVTTEHHQVITKTETKEVNVLKWWQEGLIYIGVIAVMFVLAKAIVTVVKLYAKIPL